MPNPRRRRRRTGPTGKRISIRLTAVEHQALEDAAAGPGLGVSVARFVAEAALTAAGATPPRALSRSAPSRLALAEIAEATSAVNRVGNNLNQLAREKNATGRRPPGTFAEVEQALVALDRLTGIADRAVDQ